jgi:hypothetical protein
MIELQFQSDRPGSSELFLAKLQRTSYWSLYAQELNFFSVPIDQKVTENLISEKDLQKK